MLALSISVRHSSDSEGMGMVFGIGRKDARDIQDAQAPAAVPYKLASYEHDHEGKRIRSSKVVYSFWSASKYVLILSLILWWLPMFGQMIAGYVGGRRAGGPWRGVAASILPVVCLYTVMTGFDSGFFPSHLMGVAIAPAAISAALSESVPFVTPYIQFSSEYVGSFVDALAGASPYGINTYILTVAFAYVGGVLAEQSRREIEFNSGAMMSNTTVLVADHQQHGQLQAAQYPYPPSHHGLAHVLSSAFPWSRHEQAGLPRAFASHHGHSSWSRATPMRFDDESGIYAPEAMLPPMGHDAHEYSRATTRSRPTRTVRTRVKRGDPWQRADRRVKHTFTSARRFADEPRAEPEFQRGAGPSHHGGSRIVPGDARSVKKAKRLIDNEWGHKRYPTLEDRPARRARSQESEDSPEEKPQHHAPRPPGNQWDSI